MSYSITVRQKLTPTKKKKDKMKSESNRSSLRANQKEQEMYTLCISYVGTSGLLTFYLIKKKVDTSYTPNVCKHKIIYM